MDSGATGVDGRPVNPCVELHLKLKLDFVITRRLLMEAIIVAWMDRLIKKQNPAIKVRH